MTAMLAPVVTAFPSASVPAAKAPCDARRAQRLKICLSRQARIEQFQLPGRIKEQRHCGSAAPQVQGELSAQALKHGLVELAQRPGRCGCEERGSLLGCSG